MSRSKSRLDPYTREITIRLAKKYNLNYGRVYSEYGRMKFDSCNCSKQDLLNFENAMLQEQLPDKVKEVDTYVGRMSHCCVCCVVRFDV